LSASPHSPLNPSVDGGIDRSAATPADQNGRTSGGQGTGRVAGSVAGGPLTASAASPRQPAVRPGFEGDTALPAMTSVNRRDSGGAPLARTGGSIAVLLAVAGMALAGGALVSRKVRGSRRSNGL
jgi:LPXTG-motif cell wall-anchored protein